MKKVKVKVKVTAEAGREGGGGGRECRGKGNVREGARWMNG